MITQGHTSINSRPLYIKHIAGAVRSELGLEEPYWNRSITKPHRSELGMFLEAKSFTGARADRLKFETKGET